MIVEGPELIGGTIQGGLKLPVITSLPVSPIEGQIVNHNGVVKHYKSGSFVTLIDIVNPNSYTFSLTPGYNGAGPYYGWVIAYIGSSDYSNAEKPITANPQGVFIRDLGSTYELYVRMAGTQVQNYFTSIGVGSQSILSANATTFIPEASYSTWKFVLTSAGSDIYTAMKVTSVPFNCTFIF